MIRRTFVTLTILVCTQAYSASDILAPGYRTLEFPAPSPNSYSLPSLGAAPDGSVVDSNGKITRLHTLFDDRIVLLSFIYTRCDDVNGCPLATSVLHKVKRNLAEQTALAADIKMITVSFDPAHDTPQVMTRYGEYFRGGLIDWQFVTTRDDKNLLPILKGFGQTVIKMTDKSGNDSGRFSHILRVFLIDKNKSIRNIYSTAFLHSDTLLSDIQNLRLENNGLADPKSSDQHMPQSHKPAQTTLGLPPLRIPENNAVTDAKIKLGHKLFFDRRLSLNNTMSCAMCHIPEQGFTNNELATSVGVEGRTVRRNAPTLYNVGHLSRLFHDGREYSLEQQVWGPLLAVNEMANPSIGHVLEKIRSLPDYKGLFEAAFESKLATAPSNTLSSNTFSTYTEAVNMQTVGMALATYQRTLNAADSAFDRWYFAKVNNTFSANAKAGFKIFTGKGNCSSCHSLSQQHALFTDSQLHNTGIGYQAAMQGPKAVTMVEVAPGQFVKLSQAAMASISEPKSNDLGLYEITQSPEDRWKYRTPSLRNIALTAPYMHDGSLNTLEEVVAFYNHGGFPNENQDSRIKALNLNLDEQQSLVAFLKNLTGSNIKAIVANAIGSPVSDPSTAYEAGANNK